MLSLLTYAIGFVVGFAASYAIWCAGVHLWVSCGGFVLGIIALGYIDHVVERKAALKQARQDQTTKQEQARSAPHAAAGVR